jgi:hypothetical protein
MSHGKREIRNGRNEAQEYYTKVEGRERKTEKDARERGEG